MISKHNKGKSMEPKEPDVLMSATNPTGYKLEDLLQQVRVELMAKTQKVARDTTEFAYKVRANNLAILSLLDEAERIQRDSMDLLATKAKDEGPLGAPRIGPTS